MIKNNFQKVKKARKLLVSQMFPRNKCLPKIYVDTAFIDEHIDAVVADAKKCFQGGVFRMLDSPFFVNLIQHQSLSSSQSDCTRLELMAIWEDAFRTECFNKPLEGIQSAGLV